MKSSSTFSLPEGIGNLLKLHHDGDRALQLLLFNEQSLLVVYKLLGITSSHMRVPAELNDAHEWINEISTIPNYYLAKPQPKEMGLAKSVGKNNSVELNSKQKSQVEQKGKSSLDFDFQMNTNHESMAYRSFRSSKFETRGARKVTTRITGL
ncbi:32350_t:CDS:2 [Gigaspora margarita]|uniref:32350_t:CDS:1 n=1 Tax=Gigaspora margarita TaxID=4874 RepID=A0ABN7VJD2_GIGMA|nr:32350_t:CDS:2 [Gigaspora margarita]